MSEVEDTLTSEPSNHFHADNDELPSPNCRWVPSRKLQVVNAVISGRVSLETVLERYNMSPLEFKLWERNVASAGAKGLRVTRSQQMRRSGQISF